MPKAIDRILFLIKSMGMSVRQFDISIGASNGYTLRMNKNRASVGSDVLEKIVEKYPKVNLNWLVTGRGTMFQTEDEEPIPLSPEEIEAIIEDKIQEHRDAEMSELLDRIKQEMEITQKKIDEQKKLTK